MKSLLRLIAATSLLSIASIADANGILSKIGDAAVHMRNNTAVQAPAGSQIEVAFSPNKGSEDLVVKAIRSAKSSIRVAAYSFTAPVVVEALLGAKKRGVDVRVVVDYKNNFVEGCGGNGACKGKHAVGALQNAGVPVRVIKAFAIYHNKFLVVDMAHVETGSYNYSVAAATRNAENVMVIWNNPALAKAYNDEWESHWSIGEEVHN